MFHVCFNVVSDSCQACVRSVSKAFLGSFKGVWRKFYDVPRSFKDISMVFQGIFIGIGVQECFKEVSFCNLIVACQSLHLLEYKKGMFLITEIWLRKFYGMVLCVGSLNFPCPPAPLGKWLFFIKKFSKRNLRV